MNRRIIYVASTAILVLEILVGAFMDLAHLPYVVQDVCSLGYPTYVLYIVGVWKVLAVGALLWPRLPRLMEWAYAGSLLRDVGRGGISCSGRRSHRQICRATGFHLSHVGLLVVPAGPGNTLQSPPDELTLRSRLLVFRAGSGGFMAIVMGEIYRPELP